MTIDKQCERVMGWTLTQDALPEKPGKANYEHVWCIIRMKNGDTLIRPWNCEHLVWDDEEGDDFQFHPKEPVAWMPLDALPPVPTPPAAGRSDA